MVYLSIALLWKLNRNLESASIVEKIDNFAKEIKIVQNDDSLYKRLALNARQIARILLWNDISFKIMEIMRNSAGNQARACLTLHPRWFLESFDLLVSMGSDGVARFNHFWFEYRFQALFLRRTGSP